MPGIELCHYLSSPAPNTIIDHVDQIPIMCPHHVASTNFRYAIATDKLLVRATCENLSLQA